MDQSNYYSFTQYKIVINNLQHPCEKEDGDLTKELKKGDNEIKYYINIGFEKFLNLKLKSAEIVGTYPNYYLSSATCEEKDEEFNVDSQKCEK